MRYDNLFMDFSGKYTSIRYNPDKFIDQYNTSKNPFFQKRKAFLENNVDKHIERIERADLIEIHNVFYNEHWYKHIFLF